MTNLSNQSIVDAADPHFFPVSSSKAKRTIGVPPLLRRTASMHRVFSLLFCLSIVKVVGLGSMVHSQALFVGSIILIVKLVGSIDF